MGEAFQRSRLPRPGTRVAFPDGGGPMLEARRENMRALAEIACFYKQYATVCILVKSRTVQPVRPPGRSHCPIHGQNATVSGATCISNSRLLNRQNTSTVIGIQRQG